MRAKLAMSLLTAAVVGSAAGATELRYNSFDVPRSTTVAEMMHFFDELKAESKGALTGRIFTGGQLLNAPATLKGIGDGVVDGGFVVPSLNQGELKNTNVLPDLLPFVTDAYVAAAAAIDTALVGCAECRNEFAAAKVVWLGGYGPDPWHLMCRDPVTKLSDLQGRKVRVTGASPTRLIRTLGAVPVQLPPTEISTAMQGGQIDCACGPLTWLRDYALYDLAKTVVDAPFGVYSGLGTFVFNSATYASLDQAQRKALLKVIPASAVHGTTRHLDTAAAARETAKQKGVVFWQPDEAFKNRVQEFRKGEIPNLIEDMRKRGTVDPDTLIKLHLANIEKWEKKLAEIGNDRQRLVDELREQVYAKVIK